MSGGDRLPWMKFWPADWRSEQNLRVVSLSSRGLWIELLALMHDADPYGHLLINGAAPTPKQIAALVGGVTAGTVLKLLDELEKAGVFSRTEEGVIYSRRMVRDNVTREKAKDYGRQGGNPALKPNGHDLREGVNPPHKPTVNVHARAVQRPEAEEETRVPAGRDLPLNPRAPAPLPLGWLPSEGDEAFAVATGLDPMATSEAFRDWYHGNVEVRGDWSAVWRTWCRNQRRFDDRDAARRSAPARRETVAGYFARVGSLDADDFADLDDVQPPRRLQ
jgi:hypothetical protein